MIDLMNDPTTWDYALSNGDLVLVQDADCVQQYLTQRLQMYRGEWFLDLSQGVPYYQDILVKNPNPVIIDAALKTEILNVEGVLELLAFSMDYNSTARSMTVSFTVRTIDGPIDLTVPLGGG